VKILFVNLSALRFTAKTPDEAPLGGSESALCYLSRALSRRGHEVAIISHLPESQCGIIENIAHYPVATLKDMAFFIGQKFDAIIVCNAPAACAPLKALLPSSRMIFWAHALPDQPAMQILQQPEAKDAIDAVLFVSEWQRGEVERAFGVFRRSFVVGNGIAPAFENLFASPEDLLRAKQNRAAYTTTPYRGLSVLARAMRGFDRATGLEVFSSMRVYQAGDEDYAPLFDELAQNPAIRCHGAVTQSELARHLRGCAFLFYPSIYPETFCITAAEAMAAGMKVVSTRLGALPETTMGFADLVPLTSGDGDILVRDFCQAMQRAVDLFVQNPTGWAQEMFAQSQRVNRAYNWMAKAVAWEEALAA
jgi:glycosyltransferase involved in cell wall biosynthesis